MINDKKLELNIIETLLKLYEEQENIRITVIVKNKKTTNKYLYKDGNINEK